MQYNKSFSKKSRHSQYTGEEFNRLENIENEVKCMIFLFCPLDFLIKLKENLILSYFHKQGLKHFSA